MKNSKKYTANLQKFWRKNKPAKKVIKSKFKNPIDMLVYASILEQVSPSSANRYFKKLSSHFVDWNDLRVSRDEEIIEVLGGDAKKGHRLSAVLRGALQSAFQKNDCLDLDYITELGKRMAKEELESFVDFSPFVIGYIMLFSLEAHSIPLNERMVKFMKENNLADTTASIAKVQGFVERVISASDNMLFFDMLLQLSKSASAVKVVKKSTSKSTSKPKTASKSVSKTKTTVKKTKKKVKKTTKKSKK